MRYCRTAPYITILRNHSACRMYITVTVWHHAYVCMIYRRFALQEVKEPSANKKKEAPAVLVPFNDGMDGKKTEAKAEVCTLVSYAIPPVYTHETSI